MDKKSLVGMVVCILILLPAFSMHAAAESDTKLYVEIIGGCLWIHNYNFVQGEIVNVGDNPAYIISYTFSITGGYNSGINETFSGTNLQIDPMGLLGINNDAFGFGPVIITLTASASNADTVTRITKGFQIGKFTLVSFSSIRYLIFKLMMTSLEKEQMKLSLK